MAFIKTQRLKHDDSGNIVGGTAAILDTFYDAGASGHSRHRVRENLGRVWQLAADKKSGVFESPTRGLVAYDVINDVFEPIDARDPRIAGNVRVPEPPIHTTFGDVFLLSSLLKKAGWIDLLKAIFPKEDDYERLLAHVMHTFLKDGSRIKCDTFIEQSALSNVLRSIIVSSLRSDTEFFEKMGADDVKLRFFRVYAQAMRVRYPQFGRACYVDSTELPDDITGSPYNALRCEKGKGCSVQMRLALVLDDASGLPVWFEIVPGNLMDVSTLDWISEDVKTSLGIEICSVVVDSGYVSAALVRHYGGTSGDRTMIARMPHRKGYPYKTLYHKVKDQIDRGKYDFVRAGHVYFGKCIELRLFDQDLYAYVYVDKERALREYRKWRAENEDDFEQLKDRDKRWRTVSSGFFVLLSNIKSTPQRMLDDYLRRVDIELTFKDAKSFEGLLPLAKWTDRRVRGKILADMIDTMIRVDLMKDLSERKEAFSDLFHDTASVACFRSDNRLRIETPNKQARLAYKAFNMKMPLTFDIGRWAKELRID